jgi:N-acetylglutamate synthase-like GNAT family acetyltransferase
MIRLATATDLLFIRDLQRRFTNQIGFLPTSRVEKEIEKQNILLQTLNDDDAGFLLTIPSLSYQPKTTAIIQTAVRMDAQRQAVGLDLVHRIETAAQRAGQSILQAWCKQNLEANLFWKAAGFEAIATRPGGNGKQIPHVLWRKALSTTAELSILPVDHRHNRLRGRFARTECREVPTLIPTPPPSMS